LQREDCRDAGPDPDGDPRRRPGEAENRFMVLRRRRDVPAGRRFSHAIQGLVACQEKVPAMKVVIRSNIRVLTMRDEYPYIVAVFCDLAKLAASAAMKLLVVDGDRVGL
jgi:hypothetical protein